MIEADPPERRVLALRRPDLLRQAAWIGGAWVGEAELAVQNPATGRVLGGIPDVGAEGAAAAVDAAEAALGGWRALPARTRSEHLMAWFDLMGRHAEDLARLLSAEQGKPLTEAKAEIAYAAAYVRWFAEEAVRAYGEITPGPASNRRVLTLKQPVGVVAAITPWNFPAAMVTRKVAPALAAGCTIVLKPSELTPFTALALGVLAEEAQLPPGVFNIVTGRPEAVGRVMTDDPQVRKLSFTGSTAVGKLLAARCAPTLKRLSLELGGNAPFVVFADSDLDVAVESALIAKFRNTGQTCVCANRFLVQAEVYDRFAAALADRAAHLRVGDSLAGPNDQGPLINEAALEKVERHVADALDLGARALTGGATAPGSGAFYAPTVLTNVSTAALLAREETFGPVAGLIRFESEAEAIDLANTSAAGLAAYVHTRDLARSWRVSEALEYGMVGVNTGLISNEAAPFGGVKDAGIGREGSRHGLDEYLDLKAVTLAI